jgi:hypothetical protein
MCGDPTSATIPGLGRENPSLTELARALFSTLTAHTPASTAACRRDMKGPFVDKPLACLI